MISIPETFALARQHHLGGNLSQAEQLYRLVLQEDPYHIDANIKLANVFFMQANFNAAVALFRFVLQLQPDYVVAHYNLGLALQRLAKYEEALGCYQQSLRLQPDLLVAQNNTGIVLRALGRLDEAIACYRRILQWKPDYADVHVNLGNALIEQNKIEEALASFRQAISLRPTDADTHYTLGMALSRTRKIGEANAAFRQAILLNPQHVEAHYELGITFQEQGKLDDALASYDQALRWDPRHGAVHLNRSLIYLLRGDWARGLPEYEWRWTQPGFTRRPCPQPQWDGAALNGRTILLYAEQGLGDTIQFIRYVPLVKKAGGKVVLECQPPLWDLLANVAGIDHLLARGTPLPAFDVHAPLLSLPGIFRHSPTNVPALVPYLDASLELVNKWRQELAPLRGLKIGIVWQGNPGNPSDRLRSIPLGQFTPLAQVGIQLISLQKGPGAEQLPAVAGQFSVCDVGSRLGSFADTAAVLKSLDLVISCDTAVAHLAGAMAVPVWLALPTVPDWRWLLQREDSPWYPTMRLFRQTLPGKWDDVFERIAVKLFRFVRQGKETADLDGTP